MRASSSTRRALQAPPRYGHMAIHPYPSELEGELTPARRHGAARCGRSGRRTRRSSSRFFDALSEHSRYQRFLNQMAHLPPQMLARFTQLDYDRELALVALAPDGERVHRRRALRAERRRRDRGVRAHGGRRLAGPRRRPRAARAAVRLRARSRLPHALRPHPEREPGHARTSRSAWASRRSGSDGELGYGGTRADSRSYTRLAMGRKTKAVPAGNTGRRPRPHRRAPRWFLLARRGPRRRVRPVPDAGRSRRRHAVERSDSAYEPGETLAEAEDEIGISDWIDPDTGEPAEESIPRTEDH